MSWLGIYHQADPQTLMAEHQDAQAIAAALKPIGVHFERWPLQSADTDLQTDADILALYATQIEQWRQDYGYRSVDVVHLRPEHPDRAALRQKFLSEHTHAEEEVRFFVSGCGLFSMHAGQQVYVLLCEAGDLIRVPDGLKHWFDMGPNPQFTAIRLFSNPSGWVATFTEDSIADRFPRLEPDPEPGAKPDSVSAPAMVSAEIRAILTDIEGTTSRLSFVKAVLFPYARARLAAFVRTHLNRADVQEVLQAVREMTQSPQMETEAITDQLLAWSDADEKITPLKLLQGLIWEEGYHNGDYQGEVYPDVVDALQAWQKMGLGRYVYSSGSVAAQKLLFAHTAWGDLTPLFDGYFDTTVGGKLDSGSYRRIAQAIGLPPEHVLFLSDHVGELDAAAQAGMATRCLRRDPPPVSQPSPTAVGQHVAVVHFGQIQWPAALASSATTRL
ncbi:MAG: acireductone synthase [Candidatus Melainabacteria bacterium]|nr:acireductone synthase [Candidatus Melainabacteria bacterium]